MKKQRKIPLRTCVVTKEVLPKKDLIRIVANKAGEVLVDLKGKAPGRGAYLKLDKETIEKARKNKNLFAKLGAEIPVAVFDMLLELLDGS